MHVITVGEWLEYLWDDESDKSFRVEGEESPAEWRKALVNLHRGSLRYPEQPTVGSAGHPLLSFLIARGRVTRCHPTEVAGAFHSLPFLLVVGGVAPFWDTESMRTFRRLCRWSHRLPAEARRVTGRGMSGDRFGVSSRGALNHRDVDCESSLFNLYCKAETLLAMHGFYLLEDGSPRVGRRRRSSHFFCDKPLFHDVDVMEELGPDWRNANEDRLKACYDSLLSKSRFPEQQSVVLPAMKSIQFGGSGKWLSSLTCPNLKEVSINRRFSAKLAQFLSAHSDSVELLVMGRNTARGEIPPLPGRMSSSKYGMLGADDNFTLFDHWDRVRPWAALPPNAVDGRVAFIVTSDDWLPSVPHGFGFSVVAMNPQDPKNPVSILRACKALRLPGSAVRSLAAVALIADSIGIGVEEDSFFVEALSVNRCRGGPCDRRAEAHNFQRGKLARNIHVEGHVCGACGSTLSDLGYEMRTASPHKQEWRHLSAAPWASKAEAREARLLPMLCDRIRTQFPRTTGYLAAWNLNPRGIRRDCPHHEALKRIRKEGGWSNGQWFVEGCDCDFYWDSGVLSHFDLPSASAAARGAMSEEVPTAAAAAEEQVWALLLGILDADFFQREAAGTCK
eukprot:Polyplicarium_translucidae@DN3178_c0_g1_i9.p1